MNPIFWEILIILLLIVANGFFAGAELAIIGARRGRLLQMVEEGDRSAQLVLDLAANPNRFLPTVQIGITLIGTFAATFAGDRFVDLLAQRIQETEIGLLHKNAQSISFVVVVASVTFLSLILGELVPKRLALRSAESFARVVAPVMTLLSKAARPLVWLMGATTNSVLFLLGVRAQTEPSVSVDDIEHMIATGMAEGVLEPVEQRLALEALRLGDRTVRDVMRPRIDLDAIDIAMPESEIIGAVAMAGFSRIPVYEGDLDHIIGFIHIKDLFRQQHLGWPMTLRKLLHPPVFVPETMPLDRLLQLLQEQRTHLAIVLDEYGGTEGIITLEDVMEELVGEISDNQLEDRKNDFVQRDEHSWLIDGGYSIVDMFEKLDLDDDPASQKIGNFSTVSGLVMHILGRIPKVGDIAQWGPLTLEVVDMDGQRIDRVLVQQVETSPESAAKPPKEEPKE